MNDLLLKEERQKLILDTLTENNRVTVTELSQHFGTSEVTIRRDLAELAADGKLLRAHRGALRVVPAPPEPPVVQRLAMAREEKERIAQVAANQIMDGEAIFIGSGSTMSAFAHCLTTKHRLIVFTNALNIAVDLSSGENDLTVVVTGGVVRREELSMLGHIAELSLSEVRVSKVVMGAQALSVENGWTSDQMSEVTTTRRIFEMASELIVLSDHTKLNRSAAAFIAPIQRINILVTDIQADPTFLDQVRRLGVKVLVA